MALKQILLDAKAKIEAERETAINLAINEANANVIEPKANELEKAKLAAIDEKTATYNANLQKLTDEYNNAAANLKTAFDQEISDLRASCEAAKSAYKDAQTKAIQEKLNSQYATKITELDKIISSTSDQF